MKRKYLAEIVLFLKKQNFTKKLMTSTHPGDIRASTMFEPYFMYVFVL